MKYYEVELGIFTEDGHGVSHACGDRIFEADAYLERIQQGEIVENAPVFNYFFLKGLDEKKYWEQLPLRDVYDFIGPKFRIGGWFVSDELKLLLESFHLPVPHRFYPSKLLYRGDKYNYYIFQFAGKSIYKTTMQYIDYESSIFLNQGKMTEVRVKDREEYLLKYQEIFDESKNLFEKGIRNKKIILKEALDFFPMRSWKMGSIVSEKFKKAVETMGITGFVFSELNYEVIVPPVAISE